MGYDGEKIAEANRKIVEANRKIVEANLLKAVGARKVGKFWGKNEKALVVVAVAIFLLALLILSIAFSPKATLPPEQEKKAREAKKEEESIPRLIPSFPDHQPNPRLPWEKRDGITPIHWSDHGRHGDGHHGHHDYGHYRQYYYPYPVRPWGGYYSYPYVPYGYDGGYGEREPSEPRCFELRQPDGAYLKWCL